MWYNALSWNTPVWIIRSQSATTDPWLLLCNYTKKPTEVSVVYRVSSVDDMSWNTAMLPFGQTITTACLPGQTEILNTGCLWVAVTIRCHSINNSWSTKLSKTFDGKTATEMSHSLGDSLRSAHTYILNLLSLSLPVYIHLFCHLVSLFDSLIN